MSRVTILVFCTVAALVHASRDDESQTKGDVKVSVGTRSFKHEALAQLHQTLMPEDKGSATAESLAQAGVRAAAEASSGLNSVHDQSAKLRQAMDELDLDSGLDEAAKEDEDSKAKAKVKAEAKLQEVAVEMKHVTDWADDLDRRIHDQYDVLHGNKAAPVDPEKTLGILEGVAAKIDIDKASLLSIGQQFDIDSSKLTQSEAEQLVQLEKQTNTVMSWFEEFKDFKFAMEQMRGHKNAALKEAQDLGMTQEQIQQVLAKPPPMENQPKMAGTPEQRKQLADVMASSAVEMAQIESAANEVMKGLDEFSAWKQKDDKSPESLAEAAKVKAKLDKAMQFLKEHEGAVEERSGQIDTLMKQVGMKGL